MYEVLKTNGAVLMELFFIHECMKTFHVSFDFGD